jgi:Alpha-glutamyl/putrescinyl thymine pyrophosphorylase clade 3
MTNRNSGIAKRHLDPAAARIHSALRDYSEAIRPLAGIQGTALLDCFVKQIIDSIRRVEYVKRIAAVNHDKACADPSSARFDPLKAAVLRSREGRLDDAVWLTFLAVHFGKHSVDGWALVREVYNKRGEGGRWDWERASANTDEFVEWLKLNEAGLKRFRFSNHRKYESLRGESKAGAGSVMSSFIGWAKDGDGLSQIIRDIHVKVGQEPTRVFDSLYLQMGAVRRFGRLAKFDFLTLLGKTGVAPIVPGSAYMWDNATGPYRGMRLLVTGDVGGRLSRREADVIAVELANHLVVGLQEIEDSVCNWQKSPERYRCFRG